MKTLLILLTTILLVSCEQRSKEKAQRDINGYTIIEVEECEYYTNDRRWDLCHKGNCSNRIHTYNKNRDYQLTITDSVCYIYDNNRLVGKCPMKDNMIEQLIEIDNQ